MSLQLAAQHMASRGRGPDTQLVHMAPQEVAGLQALAKANGGSLTINPDTGLAEAGFLSKLLPTLIGVGLSVASGGALTPLMAAGITGAGYGLATGSLSKGLMAGLGAYGGAGLAGSLASAGTGALSSGANAASAAGNIGEQALGVQVGAPIIDPVSLSQQGANIFGSTPPAGTPGVEFGMDFAPVNAITAAPAMPPSAPLSDPTVVSEATQERLLANKLSTSTPMDKLGAGFSELKNDPMRFMNKDNMRYGLSALSSIMSPEERERKEREKDEAEYYSFNAGYQGGPDAKGNYFAPKLSRINTKTPAAADGGLMDIGTVQAMSDRNMAQSMMANGGQGFATGGKIQMQGTFEAGGGGGGGGGNISLLNDSMGQPQGFGAQGPGQFGQMGNNSSQAPQGFAQMGQRSLQMDHRSIQIPGSTMLAGSIPGQQQAPIGGLNGYGAAMGGLGNRGAAREAYDYLAANEAKNAQTSPDQKYEQYAAYNNRQLAMQRQTNTQQYIAPTMSRAEFDASLNAPRAPINSRAYMKEGGTTKAVKPVEDDPYYTMSGPSADAFKYLMGERASSRPTPVATPVAAPVAPPIAQPDASTTSATSGAATDIPTFSYDPTTGKLTNTGNRANPMAKTAAPTDSGYFYEGNAGLAQGGLSALSMAQGGYNLGDYSDGGRLLRGPGDGVSDSIPASIGDKRPARLADGEFVIPARIVSELGNGSTEAGARQLYAMMDRVQNARKKSIGKKAVAVNSRSEKMLPA